MESKAIDAMAQTVLIPVTSPLRLSISATNTQNSMLARNLGGYVEFLGHQEKFNIPTLKIAAKIRCLLETWVMFSIVQ